MWVVSGKSWVNNHAHVLRTNDYCSNRWLYRSFQYKNILPFLQDSASMTRRKLTKASLASIPARMPSQDDQIRVLDALDQLDEVCQNANSHLKKCVSLYKDILASLLHFS